MLKRTLPRVCFFTSSATSKPPFPNQPVKYTEISEQLKNKETLLRQGLTTQVPFLNQPVNYTKISHVLENADDHLGTHGSFKRPAF